jgi:hypothetical protein
VSLAAFALCSLIADSLASGPDPTAITGGDPTPTCAFPSAVWMSGCSGTLVGPHHVIFASHCTDPSEVFLGEDATESQGVRIPVESCARFPNGRPGAGNDFAVCRLAFAAPDVPIIPPLMGCELDVLQPGVPVTVVGFGLTPEGDFARKHAVTTALHGFNDAGEAMIGGDGQDSCRGDSGGPAFVELPDGGGWRFFGITSYGEPDCTSGGYYALVHEGMPWFEEAAAQDFTPCTDADGQWDPDPRCTAAPLRPQDGGGDWMLGCDAGSRTGSIDTCGAPFADPPDTDAPQVAIATPSTGTEYATQVITGVAMVDVTVDADDLGWGVRWVELHADGEPLPAAFDASAPYTFAHGFEPGVYEVTAVAVDFAGLQSRSEAIWIGIDESPPAIPSPDPNSAQSCAAGKRTAPWWLVVVLPALLVRRRGRERRLARAGRPTR